MAVSKSIAAKSFIPVKNTGAKDGDEVVQIYVKSLDNPDAPIKSLKGFKKVFLQPGESAKLTFDITDEALSFFDADAHKWVLEPGEFVAHVGSASDDIRTSVKFNVK